eukprot:gene12647-14619_t
MAAALLAYFLLDARLDRIDWPFSVWPLAIWLALPLSVLAVAGIANAINIIDGFNGLASVVTICMLLSLGYVALQVNDMFVLVAALMVAGATAGFLIWNYPVGLIFLGDGGAYFIGFMLGELALLLVVQLALSLYAWTLSERALLPEFGRKAHTTGAALSAQLARALQRNAMLQAAQLARALEHGIPLQRLEGVPEFFADVLKQNRDLAYLRIADASGTPLHGSTQADSSAPGQFLDTALPLLHQGRLVGRLHVGVDRNHIAARVRELRYDIGIVLITSLLIAFEILWFVVTLTFTAPMRQILALMNNMAAGDFRQRTAPGSGARTAPDPGAAIAARLHALTARINQGFGELLRSAAALRDTSPQKAAHAEPLLQRLRQVYQFGDAAPGQEAQQPRIVLVRVLSFLFMFAEMLSRPFLPVYAASLPSGAVAGPLHASLPVTAFLLGVALTMPFAGHWSDRLGRRSSYVAGALTVMAGLAVTGLVPDYYALVGARAVTGVGYAIMFMACQGYVFDHTDGSNRGKGMALFVGAIMVAEICAPAVGGILADRIGYRMVFLLGAAVALLVLRTYRSVSPLPVVDALKLPAPALNGPKLRVWLRVRLPLKVSTLSGSGTTPGPSLPSSTAKVRPRRANLSAWSAWLPLLA